jgi:hypothetical protein
MTQSEDVEELRQNEYYKCPFAHAHPRHKEAFFKNFDSHFSIFRKRVDHLSVLRLHEEIAWEIRRLESEKRGLADEELRKISLKAWLEAVKRCTGKAIEVVARK